jgi:hypothetical protein
MILGMEWVDTLDPCGWIGIKEHLESRNKAKELPRGGVKNNIFAII